jgi:hypothetical protein
VDPAGGPERLVFVAPDGRRARVLRMGGALLAAVALLWLVALLAGAARMGPLGRLPHLTLVPPHAGKHAARDRRHRRLVARHGGRARASVFVSSRSRPASGHLACSPRLLLPGRATCAARAV